MNKTWREIFPQAQRAQAEFLLDGEETFAAMKAAIKTADSANHYVYILGWMLDVDFPLTKDSPETLFDLLKAATDKGVEVRGLIWHNPLYEATSTVAVKKLNGLKHTTLFNDPHTFYPQDSNTFLQAVATTLKGFRSRGFLRGADKKQQEKLALVDQPWGTHRSLGAHHDKVVIVKGRAGLVGFCGGIDINPNRVIQEVKGRSVRLSAYHDVACKVDGRGAFNLLFKFRWRWDNHLAAQATSLRGATEPWPAESSATCAPNVQVVGTFNPLRGTLKRRPDRSARQAYFDIVENATTYVYIEDQYLVNLDIAKRLNQKIQEPQFKHLTIVIPQASETRDMLIPNRKRNEFLDVVRGGASDTDRKKVTVCAIDPTHWERELYHPGVHSKVLIADDTIAMIGSANVNRRSMTVDSETNVVFFDEKLSEQSFALKFRQATWKEFSKRKDLPATYQWLGTLPGRVRGSNDYILKEYTAGDVEDVDVQLKRGLSGTGLPTGEIDTLFFNLWEHAIDPWVPD